MRRRWTWPIRNTMTAEDFWMLWAFWCVLGLVFFMPACLIDTNSHGMVYFGTVLEIVVIVWGVPIALPPLICLAVALTRLLWPVLAEYAPDLLPRRVEAPVVEEPSEVSRPRRPRY